MSCKITCTSCGRECVPSNDTSAICIACAFEELRVASGGAWDNVDVLKFQCYNRHDEGCTCTGAAVNGPDDYRMT